MEGTQFNFSEAGEGVDVLDFLDEVIFCVRDQYLGRALLSFLGQKVPQFLIFCCLPAVAVSD
jgi:hypothetical protein